MKRKDRGYSLTVYDQDNEVVALAFLAGCDFNAAKAQSLTIARAVQGARCALRVRGEGSGECSFTIPQHGADDLEALAARENLH